MFTRKLICRAARIYHYPTRLAMLLLCLLCISALILPHCDFYMYGKMRENFYVILLYRFAHKRSYKK